MFIQFLIVAKIIHNFRVTIIRLSVYNYADRFREGVDEDGIYVLSRSSERVGHFRKAGTAAL